MNLQLGNASRLVRWWLFGIGMLVILYAQSIWQPAQRRMPPPTRPQPKRLTTWPRNPGAGCSNTRSGNTCTRRRAKVAVPVVLGWGCLYAPILFFSILMCACAVERFIGLRTARVVPSELVQGLGEMSAQGGFDPRRAYRLCQEYPSTLANVVKAMLLKVGRPHSEVEQTVKETKDAEATKLYANVRPIALAQTVGPMLGLLGTVQGIIMAFSQISSSTAATNSNKFTQFAEGIYTALITTFAGLCVAIPAAVFCHYFEGRIQKLFHQIDDVLSSLLPQVEKYEGKLRVSQDQLNTQKTAAPASPAPPPVVAMPAKV